MILLTPTLGGSRDNPKIGHFMDLFSQLADKIKTWQLHQCKALTFPYMNMYKNIVYDAFPVNVEGIIFTNFEKLSKTTPNR